ncbi:hypothetical protein MNB_SM-6-633 [hydrothermal vent metagenome]|uniref:Uncharacterized protein n=1 Tax=hydrothermal vent metagenome TaxID=652676 RepID=A0A1W1CAB9_9ZZZZ
MEKQKNSSNESLLSTILLEIVKTKHALAKTQALLLQSESGLSKDEKKELRELLEKNVTETDNIINSLQKLKKES